MLLNVSMWVSAAVHAFISNSEDVCFCMPGQQQISTSIHDTCTAKVELLAVQTWLLSVHVLADYYTSGDKAQGFPHCYEF